MNDSFENAEGGSPRSSLAGMLVRIAEDVMYAFERLVTLNFAAPWDGGCNRR